MANRTPAAPPGLGNRARTLWRDLHRAWTFTPDEAEVLKLACEAVDRAEKAQGAIRVAGVLIKDRFGAVKENPACKIRAAAEVNAARLLRQLEFSAEAGRVLKESAHLFGRPRPEAPREGVLMPIPKPEAIPEGLIVDRLDLMEVTSAMSSVESRHFAERAPELASNRPRATAAEMASAAESASSSRNDFEEERAVTAMIRAIRRREYERLQWLLEHDALGGKALDWALQRG